MCAPGVPEQLLAGRPIFVPSLKGAALEEQQDSRWEVQRIRKRVQESPPWQKAVE